MGSAAWHEFTLGSGRLIAVPSAHFHADFALAVNRLACDPTRRPDAVAVELGPATAAAAWTWMGELGIGPKGKCRLPCMLALLKPSFYLRPSVAARALELQRDTGLGLDELPPAVLREELGFAPSSGVMLSPTDSIVEALRCACELSVPVYGVDLEGMAAPSYPQRVLPDPGSGDDSIPAFAASLPLDPDVDPRREFAMAARLKGLLQRHRRVLFVCGMAHWQRVAALLRDDGLRPSVRGLDGRAPSPGRLRRVIVHPALAALYLDAFPAVGAAFERARRHPQREPARRHRPLQRDAILRRLLRKAYRTRFSGSWDEAGSGAKCRDWVDRPAFEQLMVSRTMLTLRSCETAAGVVECAGATLSEAFRRALRHALLEFPWAARETFPQCGYLRPALADEGAADLFVLEEDGAGPHKPQGLTVLPSAGFEAQTLARSDERRDRVAKEQRLASYRFTWRPWEDLMNALCAMAIAKGRPRRETHPEPFAGELLEGVDVRATLRERSRGKGATWVRAERVRGNETAPAPPESFPVVWIFRGDAPGEGACQWSTYFEPVEWLANCAEDPRAFRREMPTPGDAVVDIVTFGRVAKNPPAKLARAGVALYTLSGLAVFSPIFPSYRQTLAWFQATGGFRNPIVWRSALGREDLLVRDLAARAVPAGRPRAWQDLLIAVALPHARQTLTVAAPPGFTVEGELACEAARRGTAIRLISTADLPPELLQEVVRYPVLPGRLDENGATEYAAGAERVMEERLDRYRHLVPPSWQTFGLRR